MKRFLKKILSSVIVVVVLVSVLPFAQSLIYGDAKLEDFSLMDSFSNARNIVTTVANQVKVQRANAVVDKVIDGDTLLVHNNKKKKFKVRLIGIDTPESVAKNKKLVNTKYGKYASKYMRSLLPKGTRIALTYDKQKKDTYGRTLAYVWKGNVLINKKLVTEGIARAVYYAPNDKYRKQLKQAHINAKKKKTGFWSVGFSAAFPTKKEQEY